MPLRAPVLDDRKFQQIVDDAKRLIPKYCPEWTDHNVSDPGVALVELFAWMSEMLLYRVNQVPDMMYITFLKMLGIQLDAPRAAEVPVTFYLSAAQPDPVVLRKGAEVATARTETNSAIIFTTERDFRVVPPRVARVCTFNASQKGADSWKTHDLERMMTMGQLIAMFPTVPSKPSPQDAFCIGFADDQSHHVLALVVNCENAGGAGVDWKKPPIQWEVSTKDLDRWSPCEVEFDNALGFNIKGENTIILHTPLMEKRALAGLDGVEMYWLRCRLTEAQAGENHYRVSPELSSLRVEARGGTVSARHAITKSDEVLGRSDGTPGQVFRLLHTPVLALDPATDYLVVETTDGAFEPWTARPDFAESHDGDKHFVLDALEGTITLAPSLRQPSGRVYNFGAVPPKDSLLRFSRYQFGGGVAGNVTQGAICVSKTEIPYVSQVINRRPALGGRDEQTLEDAKIRLPSYLRTKTRSVTADDHEYLACEVNGVARACCLGPGLAPGPASAPKPGHVHVYIVPHVDVADARIEPDRLKLSADLVAEVRSHLQERTLLGVQVDVKPPTYIFVSVEATLAVPRGTDPLAVDRVQRQAEAELYRYINPFVGGPHKTGWPFGRDLYVTEIYALLQGVPLAQFVQRVRISVKDAGVGANAPDTRVDVGPSALVCSEHHSVIVMRMDV